MIADAHIGPGSILTHTEGLAQASVRRTLIDVLASAASHQSVSFGTFAVIGSHAVDAVSALTARRPLALIDIFTVAAFLCALVSWVALALERALCVDAPAVGAEPRIFTLIDITAGFAVDRREEAFVTQTAVSSREVFTSAIGTNARLLALIDIIADSSCSLMSRQTRHTLVRSWSVLALFIGTAVWTQTLIYIFTGRVAVGLALEATLTFTFKRAGQVHTVAPESTDVRFRALVNIDTLETAVLDHMFVTLATVAFVTSFDVDAVASAVATRFRLTFIIVLADVPLRVEMVTRVTVTDVTIQAVLALSVTTNVPAQFALVCVW